MKGAHANRIALQGSYRADPEEAAVHPPSVATKGFGCVDIRERVIVEAALAIEQGGVGGRVSTNVRPRRNHAQNNINDLRRQGAIE